MTYITKKRPVAFTVITGLVITSWCSLFARGNDALAAPRRFLAADSSKKVMAIVEQDDSGNNKIVWRHKIGQLHDLHVLPNGNILFQTSWTEVAEIDPDSDEIVWRYDCRQDPAVKDGPLEVHAFQRLANGRTMIAQSGPARIIEVDAAGRIVHTIPLQVDNPHSHKDTRLVRQVPSGGYLVCHENDGAVREYDRAGKVVWEYDVPLFGKPRRAGHGVEAFGNQAFSALRLESGNTLIGTGNGHSVLEVTPDGKIVWRLEQNDLPGMQLAWVTSLQVLPGGELLINNCHAGPSNPQLIVVTRDKKAVWTYRDFQTFGNALTNSQLLDVAPVIR